MSLPTEDIYLDHVALAVKSIDVSQQIYEDLGFIFEPGREVVSEQQVVTAFAAIDSHAHLELLEPTSDESSIAKFIANKGEGIHHLCFRVKDIVQKQKELELKGYRFIYPAPKIGAAGMLVNFIHPKSGGGVLIELSQKREKKIMNAQFHAPPLTKIHKIIIIASGSCFLLGAILKAIGAVQLSSILGLSAGGISHGLIFQFFTYPLMETDLLPLLFNNLALWFLGYELEALWGQKKYLLFLLAVTVIPGILFFLLHLAFFYGTAVYFKPLIGLYGISMGLSVAYAILFADRYFTLMFVFPVKAKVFCWVMIGIELYLAIFSGQFVTAWAHLLGMGVAYIFVKKTHFKFKLQGAKKKPGHLHIVKDEQDQNPPKYWQ